MRREHHRIQPSPFPRPAREPVDFQVVFRKSAQLQLLLDPSFVILDASDAYLAATMTVREHIVGHHLFEIFPDNPDDSRADGVNNLRSSLLRVMQTRAADAMPIQKYDVRRPGEALFEERYWRPLNWPILGDDGYVSLIVHQVEDVTQLIKSGKLKP